MTKSELEMQLAAAKAILAEILKHEYVTGDPKRCKEAHMAAERFLHAKGKVGR